jgi:hypothetical protein
MDGQMSRSIQFSANGQTLIDGRPWALAVSNIVAAGTPCISSAGNAGAAGLYYAPSPASGVDVTAVGSVDNTLSLAYVNAATYTVDDTTNQFGYNFGYGDVVDVTLPLWADHTDPTITADGCDGFDADLSGKIVLIRRGTCTFSIKAQNAFDAGADYVIFYNNAPGLFTPSLPGSPILGAVLVCLSFALWYWTLTLMILGSGWHWGNVD